MIHKLFSVYDAKAEAFMPPFAIHQTGMAVRKFADACADESHDFGKHPEDYTLFQIGTYDDGDAKITGVKELVTTGIEAKSRLMTAGYRSKETDETIMEGVSRAQ